LFKLRTPGVVLSAAFPFLVMASLHAQEFPSRPIVMVVPFTPGASTDVIMRLVGQKVSESTGQPFVVDNRSGGGGTVGAALVKEAAPNGYTLFFGHAGTHAINPAMMSKLPYDPVKDFRPITNFMSFASVLVVPKDSPARSVADLVALAKSKPEGLTYASQGVGSGGHLLGEMFRSKANINLLHVPYRGGAPAIQDTVAGRADLLFASYITAGPFVRDGRLRMLAFTSDHRSSLLAGVPTMAEAGYPGVELDYWFGIFAPVATPDAIVLRLSEEFRKAAEQPAVVEAVRGQAAELVTGTPEAFAELVKSDGERLRRVIKEIGAKID
jgi:tripartite-type tricarboxylate transporter receptor subunit TctC